MTVPVAAGKRIMIMLWKLKTLLAVSQWPPCSGSRRQKWLSYSCVVHFDAEKYESEVCARLQGYEAVKLPQNVQTNFLPSLFSQYVPELNTFKSLC